ncbi:4476_t:CDS:2 [Rhizophagus irregularis]|nr:4476_t:CDS:2 [Rhizophagus irregularis]
MSRQFEGFEEHLDPDNLSLISILQFRRYQDDFTYSKLHEHALISKFLTRLSEMPNWSEAALSLKKSGLLERSWTLSNQPPSYPTMLGVVMDALRADNFLVQSFNHFIVIFIKQQTKNEEVTRFWIDLDNERMELEIKQTQNQFIVDRSISNNKAHDLIEEQKLDLISKRELNNEPSFRKRPGEELTSTPPNKTRATDTETSQRMRQNLSPYNEEFLSDSDSDEVVTSPPLTNVFLASSQQQISVDLINPIDVDRVKPIDSSLSLKDEKFLSDTDSEVVTSTPSSSQQQIPVITSSACESSMPFESAAKRRKYINHDLADEVLKSYQIHILPDHKLIYDNVDIMEFARSIMKTAKKNQISKSPLSIGIIDIHNVECLKYLPQGFKEYIANQIQGTDDSIYFSEGGVINKFLVDCEEEVLKYLEKFDNIDSLKSLEECLDKNRINHSTSSNDLIYAENLFLHFLFLYKNDVLTQSLTEAEFNAYVWTPILRNAFLGKTDLRLKCGEVASKSYDKLKSILNIDTRGGPRLDGKGFLKSLGTEILAQEDGAINTQSKRTGDLQKLEIKDLEVYSLQSNEFQLKISTSKFLFEDTIVAMELARIEIPRTVECFLKLVVGVKVILFWKARTRKNTMTFYDTLREGHKQSWIWTMSNF